MESGFAFTLASPAILTGSGRVAPIANMPHCSGTNYQHSQSRLLELQFLLASRDATLAAEADS